MKIRRSLALILTIALMISVFASGCGAKKVPLLPGQTAGFVHLLISEDYGTFDFQQDTALQTYNFARSLFSSLVRFKGDTLDLEPELLAEMPTVENGGLLWHFKLKSGVKFSDGTTLTANDVKYTMERMLDPNGPGASQWLFEPVLGAKDIEDGKSTSLAGFKVINDTDFDITLDKPYAPFIQNLAVPSASILPEKACKAAGDKWAQQPVGSGPYILKTYEPNNLIVLEKNPNFFEASTVMNPGVDFVVVSDTATQYMNFEKGNIDIIGVSGPDRTRIEGTKDKKGEAAFTVQKSIPLNTYYITFNMNEKVFKDVRVRKAIAMAIDKQALVDSSAFNGEATVAKAFVTPGIPGSYAAGTGPALDYNVEQAKALLADAGVKDLKVTLWQRGGTAASDGNVAIQAMLQAVGITADIQITDKAVFSTSRAKGQVPFNYGNWWADIPDPDNYLYTYFYAGVPAKSMSTNYNNPAVTALLDQGRVETDPAKRAEIYQQAEKIIVQDDVAVIPLCHALAYTALQKSISGYLACPSGVENYRVIVKAKGAQ